MKKFIYSPIVIKKKNVSTKNWSVLNDQIKEWVGFHKMKDFDLLIIKYRRSLKQKHTIIICWQKTCMFYMFYIENVQEKNNRVHLLQVQQSWTKYFPRDMERRMPGHQKEHAGTLKEACWGIENKLSTFKFEVQMKFYKLYFYNLV